MELLARVHDLVKASMGDDAGHDWYHVTRVVANAQHILQTTPEADQQITLLGAYLHDIADHKFHDGDYSVGPRVARQILATEGANVDTQVRVARIVEQSSFSKGEVPDTIEGCIVQDADRLDALGAIGIARTFAYGGHAGRPIYDPAQGPDHGAHTLAHFAEKLLLLTDQMHTEAGRKIAQQRHEYLVEFKRRFLREWDGKA